MVASARMREHVGEWKVELRADSREELFAELARVIAAEAGESEGERGAWRTVVVRGRDPVGLLVDWANELIGRSEAEGRAYDEVRQLEIADGDMPTVRAELRGAPVVAWRSPLKAATYHGARLEEQGLEWVAELLFDV